MTMRTEAVELDGTKISISWSPWSGREEVRIDDTIVSKKRTFLPVSEHRFRVDSGGASREFRVRLSGDAGIAMARDGEIVFERHSGWVRYFTVVGLMVVAVVALELILIAVLGLTRDGESHLHTRLLDPLLPVVFILAIAGSYLFKKWIRRF
jgi:hypothetical protein